MPTKQNSGTVLGLFSKFLTSSPITCTGETSLGLAVHNLGHNILNNLFALYCNRLTELKPLCWLF